MTTGNGAAPEHPLDGDQRQLARQFECDGVAWLAWPSGAGAYGTGTFGPAALEAVHFARADTPAEPAYETLLPAGRFYGLFDEELATLLRAATRIVDSSERPAKPATRRGSGLL
jgi:hypothetical protein